ncbi:hypothetical protein INS_12680 [Yersinia pestis INS]|uniref:Uncharacterized protein n=1 Tax=Yersinia pseudotuberculosis serotype O:3 (strain YPIII) TaxID=502800 RepID=A0A0H3B394_YERPY|nr:hypothetical protein INS_12680 [Yersinia pestis INS]
MRWLFSFIVGKNSVVQSVFGANFLAATPSLPLKRKLFGMQQVIDGFLRIDQVLATKQIATVQ